MYNIIDLPNLDVFFKRVENCSYSIHFNGYCDELDSFIRKVYKIAIQSGVVIESGFKNPSVNNVNYILGIVGNSSELDLTMNYITTVLTKWLPQLSLQQRNLIGESLYRVLVELRDSGKNNSALKNIFIKLMCWLNFKCYKLLCNLCMNFNPVILYEGKYDTHELILLKLLAFCGCNVVVLNYSESEDCYKKHDMRYNCTKLYKFSKVIPFPQSFTLTQICKDFDEEKRLEQALGNKDLCKNIVVENEVSSNILSVIASNPNINKCYCLQINGVDIESTYKNELFELRKSLQESNILFNIITSSIRYASPYEVQKYRSYSSLDDLDCIMHLLESYHCKSVSDEVTFKYAFTNVIREKCIRGSSKIINIFAMCMRFKDLIERHGYILLLIDNLAELSKVVLEILSYTGLNILVLNPSKSDIILSNRFSVITFDNVLYLDRYPDKPEMQELTTVARKAESEISSTLFTEDAGIFKDMQYNNAKVVYLNTTFDEISVLWNEELRLRQGFKVNNGVVTLPIIYAKVNGIPNGDVSKYKALLNDFKSNSTIIFNDCYSSNISVYLDCKTNDRLDFDKISSSSYYKYDYLSSSIQRYIVSKMQELLDLKVIKGVDNEILSILLDLPREILQSLQSFDFTRSNPKIFYINTTENQLSFSGTVILNFLSLCGFDILMVVPTGYNILDKYTSKILYREYNFGNYNYSFEDNKFKLIFNKFFRGK